MFSINNGYPGNYDGLDLSFGHEYPENQINFVTDFATETPQRHKRTHKKSRTGCTRCKARKVKCDEGRPVCRTCRLRNEECIYTAPAERKEDVRRTRKAEMRSSESIDPLPVPRSPSGQLQSAVAAYSPYAATQYDFSDLRLLWFYTTVTSSSYTSDYGYAKPVANIMRTKMVQYAFQYPFLMDFMLSLSNAHARHLKGLHNEQSLLVKPGSFDAYLAAIDQGRPETYPAIFATSFILISLASQNFRGPTSPRLYIIDWLIIWWRLGRIIGMTGVEGLVGSGMHPLFQRPELDMDTASDAIPNHLLFLLASIGMDDPDNDERQTYCDTMNCLGALYHHLGRGIEPIMSLRIMTWISFLPKRFFELARERRPRALIILAYYAAFLKLVTDIWWLDGAGDRSLRDIVDFVGPEWHSYMIMPRACIGPLEQYQLVRIILSDKAWLADQGSPEQAEQDASALDEESWVDNTGRKLNLLTITSPGTSPRTSTSPPEMGMC